MPSNAPDPSPIPGDNLPVSEEVRAVGASFLRLRPWIVTPPVLTILTALWFAGTDPARWGALLVTQTTMLLFFAWEAVSLSRKGKGFVTERQLAVSLMLTVTGLTIASALTGAGQSPLLPMLLAPVGIAFAAFGRGKGLRMLGYLAAHVVVLAALTRFAPWPPLQASPAVLVGGLASVAVASLLLFVGVAALTEAHRRTAASLDRMQRTYVDEAGMRIRDLEQVGAIVAHDVKNPLTAIKSMLQLTLRGAPNENVKKRFDIALTEVHRIETILEDYLSFARPFAELRLQTIEIGSVITHVVDVFDSHAERQHTSLVVKMPEPALSVVIDGSRVRDALANLVKNALDAHPTRIELRVTQQAETVDIRIVDDGRGMSATELANVGTPYFTTRSGGTGLGVVLAQAVARQHGGSLAFSSEPGLGTTATFVIPLAPPVGETKGTA